MQAAVVVEALGHVVVIEVGSAVHLDPVPRGPLFAVPLVPIRPAQGQQEAVGRARMARDWRARAPARWRSRSHLGEPRHGARVAHGGLLPRLRTLFVEHLIGHLGLLVVAHGSARQPKEERVVSEGVATVFGSILERRLKGVATILGFNDWNRIWQDRDTGRSEHDLTTARHNKERRGKIASRPVRVVRRVVGAGGRHATSKDPCAFFA